MADRPLASVIMIFFNAASYFDEAVQSVLEQTYTHWELLLVDDGSTDRSTAMAVDYARRYPNRIRYLEHPGHVNRGMSATRNLGILHARGRYVGFLDADDVWLPHKLEQQVRWLEAYPRAGMVYGRTLIWYSWMQNHPSGKNDRFYPMGVTTNTLVAPPRLLRLLLRNKVQSPTTCNALLRREIVERVGGFEAEFRGMFEDQVFFAKIELGSHVVVVDECWARYRQHASNSSAIGSDTQEYDHARLHFLTWIERYLVSHHVRSPGVWWVLWSEMLPYRYPRFHRAVAWLPPLVSRLRRALIAQARRVATTAHRHVGA